MTNREAIEYINWMRDKFITNKPLEACDLAISALEKQEHAENEWCPDCAEYDKERHCCHRFTKVIRQTVEECKREWANEGWIPVTERLPEKDCECRVTEGDFKSMFDCHWNNHKKQFEVWSYYNDCYMPITNVTAWKPIEEPYTEETND